MFITKEGVSVLEGKDITQDYCKIHAQYFKGPECRACEEESIRAMGEAEKSEFHFKAKK